MEEVKKPIIAIIGGTGDLGSGLAKAWAAAGYDIIIGSRSKERADAAAAEMGDGVKGMTNPDAAAAATIVILTVPF
ncbi:MAG: NAD(P)-binding domain-containing protein, partial [Hyphomicrobium sp.]